MRVADLHLHTNRSDGTMTPRSLVSTCKALGIKIISVTDHDNVDSISEAIFAGEEKGVKVIPGIEMSSFLDKEVHILGYNIDYTNPDFISELSNSQRRRENRNLDILKNLENIGIHLDYNTLKKDKSSIGRIHIAIQMKERGYVASINEAFDRYIGFGCPCYIKSSLITPDEAVRVINKYGGVSVLAHPYRYIEDGDIRVLIESLKGLKGIEVYYPLHSEEIKSELINIAKDYNLIMTGGSDFHNMHSGNPIGSGRYTMDDYTANVLNIN